MMRLILSFLLVSWFKTCLCDVETADSGTPAAPTAPDPLWCYESQKTDPPVCKGPGEWNWVNVACCGVKQSPINIKDSETRRPSHTTELKFTGYDVERTMKMRNDKRTVWLEIPPGATLTWGQISYKYKATRIDFHWGDATTKGSEHTIGGERSTMEMQVLHLKDRYSNIEEAKKDPTGVAILAFLIEAPEGTDDNPKYTELVKAVEAAADPANIESPINITLKNLILTVNMTDYYSYEGSVTKPGCQPAIWIVFKTPILLNQTQAGAFYAVKYDDTNTLVNNYRPVQPLHGRVVYAGGIIPSSGAILGVSFTFILMCLIAALGCFQLV